MLLGGKQQGPISQRHLQVWKGTRILYLYYGSRVQFEYAVIARGELGSFYWVRNDSTRILNGDVGPDL